MKLEDLNIDGTDKLIVLTSSVGCMIKIDNSICYPENSTHPNHQVMFIQYMFEGDVKNKVIITHSPYILQAIRYYAALNHVEDCVKYYDIAYVPTDVTATLNDVFISFAEPINRIMNVDFARQLKK